MACDGIWDCISSEECVKYVAERLSKEKLSDIIEELFDKIIAKDVQSAKGIGCDNMTCIIVHFKE